MVDFINSWAKGIIIAVIITTIIELILPEGNNKKYVKTILGIYVLFVIIYPLISKISGRNINIESLISTYNVDEYETNNIAIETNVYIEETYKKNLEEDLKSKFNEKGYEIDNINLYVETENPELYGRINSIVMQISKKDQDKNTDLANENITENKIEQIDKVEIKLSNSKTETKRENDISKEEIDNLKEYLNINYSIEKERIHINEL